MKKILVLTVALVLVASAAYSATVVGSAHDIKTRVTGATTTEVCVFCHTVHNSSAAVPVVLWNKVPSTVATYTVYQSATLKGSVSQPSGVSKACLSCHDGSVAMNSLVNPPAVGSTGTATTIATGARVGAGGAMQTHHPVSVTYRSDLNTTMRPNTTTTVVNGTVTLPLFGTASPFMVECGSCHNVHDPANAPFLRVSNTNSQLCTTCHVK